MIFDYGHEKFKIGSRMFPLSDKENMSIFIEGNTSLIENELLKSMIDNEIFKMGHCYSNAKKVFEIGIRLGLDIKYFVGWVFPMARLPIHHAWCVLDGDVIDVSLNTKELSVLRTVNPNDPNWRKNIAPVIAKMKKENKKTSQFCVLGKVPNDMIYVGSEDEEESAKARFRELLDKYPNHISYIHKREKGGYSELQQEILRHR